MLTLLYSMYSTIDIVSRFQDKGSYACREIDATTFMASLSFPTLDICVNYSDISLFKRHVVIKRYV